MRRMRRAKIVATVGPSSSTPEKLRALFLAGVDVFRLNFSHGTQAEHRSRFEAKENWRRYDTCAVLHLVNPTASTSI
jgi:pyruvate kinase